METIIKKITHTEEDKKIYEQAGQILRAGGLVAFPTETVYGLGADALDAKASAKIYAAKGRPSDNPLIVHIADVNALYDLAKEVPDKALVLAEKFWPGPLTMILPRKPIVPLRTTGGLETVGVRCPNHPITRAVIAAADVPVILLECDALDAPQAGELLYFFELANAICAAASGVDPLAPMQFGPARTLAGKLLGKLE